MPNYIVHEFSHTILLIDISKIPLPKEIFPHEGKAQDLLSLRFQSWRFAEKFLLERGAHRDSVDKAHESLNKTGVARVDTHT